MAEGWYFLGRYYAAGSGCDVDPALAVHWLRKASDAGFVLAHGVLGMCYEEGLGIAIDPVAAVQLYFKGAHAGNTFALVKLGCCYLDGIGVAADAAAAVRWFRKAVDGGGSPNAHYYLGLCLYRGLGVGIDRVAAARLFLLAAEAGLPEAMLRVAECYGPGGSLPFDAGLSISWFTRAIVAGDADPDVAASLAEQGLDCSGVPWPCRAPGCDLPGTFHCSRCVVAVYCSQACQRAHWRAHKAKCRSPSTIAKEQAAAYDATIA